MDEKHARQHRRRGVPGGWVIFLWSGWLPLAACGLWSPPLPTDAQREQGLIVLYPGAFNSTIEMSGFHAAFREEGIDQAIEIVPWGGFMEHVLDPEFFDSVQPWVRGQAARLAAYRADHPGRPITLLGFSAGAMAAIMVTEAMPAGSQVDCVILMSPAVWRGYDLNPMLSNTGRGVVVYYSPEENLAVALTSVMGTADGHFEDPAAAVGFDTLHEKLTQVAWEPWMSEYGNGGEHADYYLNVEWLRAFVVPWIAHAE